MSEDFKFIDKLPKGFIVFILILFAIVLIGVVVS